MAPAPTASAERAHPAGRALLRIDSLKPDERNGDDGLVTASGGGPVSGHERDRRLLGRRTIADRVIPQARAYAVSMARTSALCLG